MSAIAELMAEARSTGDDAPLTVRSIETAFDGGREGTIALFVLLATD
jgi:hypothetical protein